MNFSKELQKHLKNQGCNPNRRDFTNKSYIPLSWDLNELDSFDINDLIIDKVYEARNIYLDALNSMNERASKMITK